jgi:hypothetical protein
MIRRMLTIIALASCTLAPVTASAVAAPVHRGDAEAAIGPEEGTVPDDPFQSPEGFFVSGSRGYRIAVSAHKAEFREPASVRLHAEKGGQEVTYTAPADLSAGVMRANLGHLGRIDLRWVPNGAVREIHASCHGHRRRDLFFDAGSYVGTFRFRGGRDFTTAFARRIAWRQDWFRHLSDCRIQIGEGMPGPGEELVAGLRPRLIKSPLLLRGFQTVPGARVDYVAESSEQVGKISIERLAFVSAGPKTLTFSPSFSGARIAPPAPFSGSAVFARTERGRGTWLGNLSVDFPDRSTRLAGGAFEASFHSYFREVHER